MVYLRVRLLIAMYPFFCPCYFDFIPSLFTIMVVWSHNIRLVFETEERLLEDYLNIWEERFFLIYRCTQEDVYAFLREDGVCGQTITAMAHAWRISSWKSWSCDLLLD